MMIELILFMVYYFEILAEPINSVGDSSSSNETFSALPSRRILSGHEVGDTRPYMVYLRPASNVEQKMTESHWLCGGVIIDQRYILTSAACIEDVKHFYVISGTHTWVPPEEDDNDCINNGAKRAIWKCVPQSYFYDGNDFDNIRWMVGDIAVVKVEDDFNFERKIRGCDFIPKKVQFNNHSAQLEKSRTSASIAGWGTTQKFVDIDYEGPLQRSVNSVELLESDVVLISKKGCKKHWDVRYHFIINDEMICTKDNSAPQNAHCAHHDVSCIGLESSEDDYEDESTAPERRMRIDPSELLVHTAAHQYHSRRNHMESGGFCENDHGGPLIVGQGKSSVIVGIMSACLTKNLSNQCYGPFLYTSVYKYRNLISCAIEKDTGETCKMLLRSGKTPVTEMEFDWPTDPEWSSETPSKNIARSFPQMAPKMEQPPSTSENIASQTTIEVPSDKTPATKKIQLSEYISVNKKNGLDHGNKSLNKLIPKKKHPSSMTQTRLLSERRLSHSWEKTGLPSRLSKKSRRRTTIDPYSSVKNLIMRKFFTKIYI